MIGALRYTVVDGLYPRSCRAYAGTVCYASAAAVELEVEAGPEEPGRIVLPPSQVYETAEQAGAEVVRRLVGGAR